MRKIFELQKNRLIYTVIFFWLGLIFLSIILTLVGLFYKEIIALYFISGAAFIAYLFIKNKPKFRFDPAVLAVVLLSLSAILVFSYFSSPSVFSGRDQGSFSEAAIRLSENHKLEFSTPASSEFFRIYGPGRALNFPGFNYTGDGQLITQFPIGYISWLAVFYSFFGLSGFDAANGITLFAFLLSFYLLCRVFFPARIAIIPFLFALTCFIFSWFFKITLSENLALGLIWTGLFLFIIYLKNKDSWALAGTLFSFYILLFTRIEAPVFLAIILAILYWKKRKSCKNIPIKACYAGGILIAIYIVSFFVNREFYISFAKGLLNSTADYSGISIFSSAIPLAQAIRVFNLYGLIVFLILGSAGIIFLWRKQEKDLLVPLSVLMPSFIYIIYPSITLDHPWMLRRYVFAVFPVLIFYSASFLFMVFKKRLVIPYIFSFMIILSNLAISVFYLTSSENRNLLIQTENISQRFKRSDLVLVDQKATGDGWSMISGPMSFFYDKQTVYFFNPQDIDKIDQDRFSDIYFIIPDTGMDLYLNSSLKGRLNFVEEYQINNNIFSSCSMTSANSLPIIDTRSVYGAIYILDK